MFESFTNAYQPHLTHQVQAKLSPHGAHLYIMAKKIQQKKEKAKKKEKKKEKENEKRKEKHD